MKVIDQNGSELDSEKFSLSPYDQLRVGDDVREFFTGNIYRISNKNPVIDCITVSYYATTLSKEELKERSI